MPHSDADRATAVLPLKPTWFHILLALADDAQHGYGIRAHVEGESGGRVRLWPATLYGTIRTLTDEGLIEGLDGDAHPDDDARRRYYRLTPFGKTVLRAETDRLSALVRAARATSALG
jgi:DNA-binding PadR family transcriptional regulator